jgi:hypothetical protein
MNLNSNFVCWKKDFVRDASKVRAFVFANTVVQGSMKNSGELR